MQVPLFPSAWASEKLQPLCLFPSHHRDVGCMFLKAPSSDPVGVGWTPSPPDLASGQFLSWPTGPMRKPSCRGDQKVLSALQPLQDREAQQKEAGRAVVG